jgi:hypothetical protein
MGKNKNDDAPDATTGLAEYCQNCPVPAQKTLDNFGKGICIHPSVADDIYKNPQLKEYYRKQYEKKHKVIKIGG